MSFLLGAEGETRTLAPVSRPTPLAGAPRHHLSTTPNADVSIYKIKMAERKGFEPLWLAPNGFQDRLVMTASIPLRVQKPF